MSEDGGQVIDLDKRRQNQKAAEKDAAIKKFYEEFEAAAAALCKLLLPDDLSHVRLIASELWSSKPDIQEIAGSAVNVALAESDKVVNEQGNSHKL